MYLFVVASSFPDYGFFVSDKDLAAAGDVSSIQAVGGTSKEDILQFLYATFICRLAEFQRHRFLVKELEHFNVFARSR